MSTNFYLSAMRKPPNDTEYDGVDTFTRMVSLGKLGREVDLASIRVGYCQFWINSYCYSGWGSLNTGDFARAYILIKTLPYSMLTDMEDYHVVVVTKDRRGNNIHRLINPPTDDELYRYEILVRHFLTQVCLSTTFYKNVIHYIHNPLRQKTVTPKHTDVLGWRRIVATYAETLELLTFAEHRSKNGKSTYGCMNRSNNFHKQLEAAHKRVMGWYNVNFADPSALDTSPNLGAYLLSKLDQYANDGDYDTVRDIMVFMVNELRSKSAIDVGIIPREVTAETTQTFREEYLDKYCYKPPYDIFTML